MIKFLKALRKNLGAIIITPTYILLIVLLMSACATGSRIAENNNESASLIVKADEKPLDQTAASSPQATSSSQTQINKLPQFTATGESENSKISNSDNEIECRTRIVTGSRFKKKICLTKKAWAEVAKKNSRKMDRFDRDLRYRTDMGYSSDPTTMGQMPR